MRRFEDLPRHEQERVELEMARLYQHVRPEYLLRMEGRDARCLALRLRYEAMRHLERAKWLGTREASA